MRDPKVRDLIFTAMLAAIICVLAPIGIPVGYVSITLATLGVYLVCAAAGTKRALAAVCVYILLGCAGLPVFSGFSGGMQRIAGVTGGYIIGYMPMTLIAAMLIDCAPQKRWMYPLAMVLSTIVLYCFGTAWFVMQSGQTLAAALAACVLPFLAGDALKIAAAAILGPRLRAAFVRFYAAKQGTCKNTHMDEKGESDF